MRHILVLLLIFSFSLNSTAQWDSIQKIVSNDREAMDYFGDAVSIHGSYAIVGALCESHDSAGLNYLHCSGSAYVFERDQSGNWQQVQKLVASDRSSYDYFGEEVLVHGNKAFVSSRTKYNSNYSLHLAGVVYEFERDSSGSWNEIQKIEHPKVNLQLYENLYFGSKMATDGKTLLIGDSVHINFFSLDANGSWNYDTTLFYFYLNHDIGGCDMYSLAVDGDYAVMGFPCYIGSSIPAYSGAAFVMKRDSVLGWVIQDTIFGTNPVYNDNFGWDIAINENILVVSAPGEDDVLGSVNNCGAMYFYKLDTQNGIWNVQNKVLVADRQADDRIGTSLDVSSGTAIAGSPYNDLDLNVANYKNSAGAAYLFKVDTTGYWSEYKKITPADRRTADHFGMNVALDVENIVVSAHYHEFDQNNLNQLLAAGAAYIVNKDHYELFTVHRNECDSFSFGSGQQVWYNSGVFIDTVFVSPGLKSVYTVHLHITDTSVSRNGYTLMANSLSGQFQWLDCNNNYAPIPGATQSSFTPTLNGSYAVQVTDTNCIDTSFCHTVIINGINDLQTQAFRIYPNPTNGKFYIDHIDGKEVKEVKVYNIVGEMIRRVEIQKEGMISIDLSDESNGIHFLMVTFDDGSVSRGKILKL